MQPGKFYVIEGPDGSGKSTLAKALYNRLEEAGRLVALVGFPSGSLFHVSDDSSSLATSFTSKKLGAIGFLIRSTFSGKGPGFQKACYMPLMYADGVDWEPAIIEFVKQGGVFIADRHTRFFSAFVYQRDDHSYQEIDRFYSQRSWYEPDCAFVISVPAEVALARQKSRGGDDVVWEKDDVEHNELICQRYKNAFMNHRGRKKLLDGTKSPEALLDEVCATIKM